MIVFYILILLMPFANPPFLSRIVSETVAFKVLGAACIPYTLLHLARRGSLPPYLRTWQARLFGVLYLWATASCFTRGFGWRSGSWMSYTSFVLLFFMVLSIVDTLAKVRWVLFSVNAAVALGALRIIEEWWQLGRGNPSYRAGISVGDNNTFSTTAALCLPFVFLMVLYSRKRWERLFYGACLALSLIGVTLCASRGGTLAIVVAFLCVVARSRRRLRNLILVSLMVVPPMILSPSSSLHRFLRPASYDEASVQYHLIAWKAGLRMIRTYPLLGIGLGNFKPMMHWYAPPGTQGPWVGHNTLLEIAAELGLPALGVFVGILVFAYRSLGGAGKRARVAGDRTMYLATLGLQAGLVGYLAGACFISAEYTKLFWLVIFLSMCLLHVLSVAPKLGLPAGRAQGVAPAMIPVSAAPQHSQEEADR
jgi:O-antigen ligase